MPAAIFSAIWLFHMETKFVVKPSACGSTAEQHQDPHSELIKPAHGSSMVRPGRRIDQASLTTRLMAAESRFQLAVSFSS